MKIPCELQELFHTNVTLQVAVIMWFATVFYSRLWKQVQNNFNILKTKIIQPIHFVLQALLAATKEVGLRINGEKTKYGFVSRE
jgi:hypothetical protein